MRIAWIGHSRKEAKSLMTSRSYLLYGRCDASVTSQQARSIDKTSWKKENLRNELFRDLRTCCDMVYMLDSWSFLASSSVGLFAKAILLWLIHKLQSKWTSTWNFHKASRPHTGTPRITCWSCKRTYRVRNKLIPCGQTYVHRIHTFLNWWLRFFLRWHHFHGVRGQWYLPRYRWLETSRCY